MRGLRLTTVFIIAIGVAFAGRWLTGYAMATGVTLGVVSVFVIAAIDRRLRRPRASGVSIAVGALSAMIAVILMWLPEANHGRDGVLGACLSILIASDMLGSDERRS